MDNMWPQKNHVFGHVQQAGRLRQRKSENNERLLPLNHPIKPIPVAISHGYHRIPDKYPSPLNEADMP